MGSKPKNQHYIPRVYLKPWEHENKKLWIADKDHEDKIKIDERKEEKVFSSRNLYTIKLDQEFVVKHCEKIKKELAQKIANFMNDQKVYAKDRGIEIRNLDQIESKLDTIGEWTFFKNDSGKVVSRSKIIKNIRSFTSYYLENKFNDYFENQWCQTRDRFIELCNTEGVHKVQRNYIDLIIKFAIATEMRRPNSNSVTWSKCIISNVYNYWNESGLNVRFRNEYKKQDIANQYWLIDLYKMMTGGTGYYNTFLELFYTKFSHIILFTVKGNDSFITSDNPFFIEKNNSEKGMYFPVTPKHLIFIPIIENNFSSDYEGICLKTKIINSKEIEKLNTIIKRNANKFVVYLDNMR